jgi:hypothetical protein
MCRLLVFLCVALLSPAADRWLQYRAGPFEVVTNSGERQGLDKLSDLEQFRYALGSVLGKSDLKSVWPIRVVVFKSKRQSAPYASATGLALARDAFMGALDAKGPLARRLLRDCARILIEANTNRLPEEIDLGLAELFSMVQIDGQRITLGHAPPEPERSRTWAKLHLLTVLPDHYGKLRVLVHNLERGVEAGPAYRNAFGKSPAEIDEAVEAYLTSGNLSTVYVSGRTMNPRKEFEGKQVDAPFSAVALADLWLANPEQPAKARSAHEAILKTSPASAEALEGLGLLALREQRTDEARRQLAAAVEAGSTSARAYLEYTRLESDRKKARAALQKAAELNPHWAAPHFEMAQRESDTNKKLELLATAATLEPRNAGYWQAVAEAHAAEKQFSEAVRAWASAELAASSEDERVRLRKIRQQTERKRLEYKEEERRRLAEQKEREIRQLKEKATASIRAALEKANRANPPSNSGAEVVEWWEDPKPSGKIEGVLQRVDCLGKQLRLVIRTQDGALARLLIRDPGEVVILGGREQTFGCGPQRPLRKIVVEYHPKPDAKLGTAGEAAVLDFPE